MLATHHDSEPQREISDRDYKLAIRSPMPLCKNCQHSGSHHHWRITRLRGRCRYRDCGCISYVPDVDSPEPVNKVIGPEPYATHKRHRGSRIARMHAVLMRAN